MRPERPECQCLACAQLQHHMASDTLLLVAISTVVVVAGLVWLTGQVAGLFTSGTWPDVSLAELPGILARLRDYTGDPAAAWPAGVRGLLPDRSACTPPWPASYSPAGAWGPGVVAVPAAGPAEAASHPCPPPSACPAAGRPPGRADAAAA